MEYNKLSLHKFKPSNIKKNSIIGIIGRRNAGKSTLVKNIMNKRFKETETTLVVNPTEFINPFYSDFVSKQSIYTYFDNNVIENLIDHQHDIYGRSLESNPNNIPDKKKNKSLIVLDDSLYSMERNNTTLKSIFFNSRHLDISLIFAMQGPYDLTPDLRANINYLFIFKEPSIKTRKKLYDEYCSVNISFEDFSDIFDCFEKNECLVIDITAPGDFQKKLFWYKAEKTHTDDVNEKTEIENENEIYEVIEKTETEIENVNNTSYLGYIKSFIW